MRTYCIPVAAMLILTTAGCRDDSDGTLELSGTIEGIDVRVSSEVAGRVAHLRADEGSMVNRGDTLAAIDDTDYRIQLRQASGAAAAAEAQYQLALEGARREDIVQAEAALRAAERDFERAAALLATGTITRKQFEDAEVRAITARQQFGKLSSGSREYELVAARGVRDQAEALAAQLRKKVADCVITSPQEGIVTVRAIERGELVPTGGTMFRVTSIDTVKMTVYLNQTHLALIRVGQSAEVMIDGAPERRLPATVVFISDVAEFTPKNVQTKEERTRLVFAVRLRVPNPDQLLKPGMPADVLINTVDREE